MRVSPSYSAPSPQHLRVSQANIQQPQAQQPMQHDVRNEQSRYGMGAWRAFRGLPLWGQIVSGLGAAAGGVGTFVFTRAGVVSRAANRIARGESLSWLQKLIGPNDATKASLQKFNGVLTKNLPTTHNVTKLTFVGAGAATGYVGGATVAEMHGLVEGQNMAVKAVGTAAGAITGDLVHKAWWQSFRTNTVRKSIEQLGIGKWIKPERY